MASIADTRRLFVRYGSGLRRTAWRRATHLIVHVYAHRAATGAFPDSLDELGGADLPELRIDPFSGRDLVYKRKGDSFTLYSVSEDLRDDGGRHHARWNEGDFVFWPVQD